MIGIRSKENSAAGFKACGISPFDPNKVLNNIPRNAVNEDGNQMEQAWTQAIVEHLDKLKASSGTAVKRGKKINISPGKSISTADLLISSLISTPTTIKSKKSRKQQEKEVEDEEESASNFSDLSESFNKENEIDSMTGPSTSFDPFRDSDESIPQEIDKTLSSKSQESTSTPLQTHKFGLENMNLEVGDFIISKFPTKNGKDAILPK